jgi:hypothetical protein
VIVSRHLAAPAALLALAVASGASAQVRATGPREARPDTRLEEVRTEKPAPSTGACEGCPRRRPLAAIAEVFGVNLVYNLINQVLPTDYSGDFSVSHDTWRSNIGHGFTWDNDPFVINQFGHPYQGGNYFSAGRANGLNYWESIPLTALGSLTWEWFGESTHPAWNDVINTTMGGAAFGEVLHRMAWLVRDPRQTGRSRLWREIGATVIDPIGGLNRFGWREALRPGEKPPTYQPSRAVAEVQLGLSWPEGDLRAEGSAAKNAFASFALDYGAPERGPTRAPFDAFTIAVRLGGGATVSAAGIRGRLASRSLGGLDPLAHQLLVAQEYGYREAPGFLFGEQSVIGGLASRVELRPGVSLSTTAFGGAMALGTIDSPVDSLTNRAFDYGPGATASGSAELTVRGLPVLGAEAAVWWMHTVTRDPANHVLSLVRVKGRVPIFSGLHVLVEAERVARDSRVEGRSIKRNAYPELRAALAWRFGY